MLARGKMRVTIVEEGDYAETIFFTCQYDENDPEDTKFAASTPSGNMTLQISNPNLKGKFSPGQCFYVDLTPVE